MKIKSMFIDMSRGSIYHSYKNRLRPADRTDPIRNKLTFWVEPRIESVM